MAQIDLVEVSEPVTELTVSGETVELDVIEQVTTVEVHQPADITVEVSEQNIELEVIPPAEIVVEITEPLPGEDDIVAGLLNKETDDETAADGSGYIYVGEAQPGVDTDVAAWRIKRITVTLDGSGREDLTTQWADGNVNFDNVWDNRVSLSYS